MQIFCFTENQVWHMPFKSEEYIAGNMAEEGKPDEIYFFAELAPIDGDLHYDEDTLMKVAEALRENGISYVDVPDVITAMQSRGIVFRERSRT